MSKLCPKCKIVKPASGFWRSKSTSHGLQSRCKVCRREYAENNRDRIARAARDRYLQDKKAHAEIGRRNHLRRKFGITAEQYEQMLAKQDGGCGICRERPTIRNLAIDHCHKTGAIRGLLCDRCNRLIGLASERGDLLHSAATYVNGNKHSPGLMHREILTTFRRPKEEKLL